MEANVNIMCFRMERLDDEDLSSFEPFISEMNKKLGELEKELTMLHERMDIDITANTNKQDNNGNSSDD